MLKLAVAALILALGVNACGGPKFREHITPDGGSKCSVQDNVPGGIWDYSCPVATTVERTGDILTLTLRPEFERMVASRSAAGEAWMGHMSDLWKHVVPQGQGYVLFVSGNSNGDFLADINDAVDFRERKLMRDRKVIHYY